MRYWDSKLVKAECKICTFEHLGVELNGGEGRGLPKDFKAYVCWQCCLWSMRVLSDAIVNEHTDIERKSDTIASKVRDALSKDVREMTEQIQRADEPTSCICVGEDRPKAANCTAPDGQHWGEPNYRGTQ